MQINRSHLQRIVRDCAREAAMPQIDYEAIFDALDKTEGVSFLTFGGRYGCPLSQAFGGDHYGRHAAVHINELNAFKDYFDEAMLQYFDVPDEFGKEYNAEVVG